MVADELAPEFERVGKVAASLAHDQGKHVAGIVRLMIAPDAGIFAG